MNFDKFEPFLGQWAEKFKPFIESEEMDKIYAKLKKDGGRGKIICPDSKDTFRVFEEVSPTELKVIWILSDPYPWVKFGKKVACGVAMDCRNTGILQPSLELFYNEIIRYYNKGDLIKSPSLSYLSMQGIMMLNSDLTCEMNKPSSHKGLWEKFMAYFIEEVLAGQTGLIFVLSGLNSEKLEKYINPLFHYILKCEHPAAASHQHREWESNDIFKRIDYILKINNNVKINWMLEKLLFK